VAGYKRKQAERPNRKITMIKVRHLLFTVALVAAVVTGGAGGGAATAALLGVTDTLPGNAAVPVGIIAGAMLPLILSAAAFTAGRGTQTH